MLNRNFTLFANYLLDNFVPPIIRDRKWFMRPIIMIAYGSYTNAIMGFKENLPFMDEQELSDYYSLIKDAPINKRESDLNTVCLEYILKSVTGESVLDAACGRGALLKRIKEKYPDIRLHGSDIVLPDMEIQCTKASICDLPFEDGCFDTVICTHALEHIRDNKKALNELLRIAKTRLIIVVPKQREYWYTPDLHIHFFPYLFSFKAFIGIENAVYLELKGDFLCSIDK